jgi:NAD-dependent SIR2 family protein deacetylase
VTLAAERGATTIEINLQPTPITDRVDHSLLGRSGELLPRLLRELDV